MENQIHRLILANEIYDRLVLSEAESIEVWRKSEFLLKLQEKNLPVLDVLTCVYNGENYLAHSIESILLQSYPNINLIIVNDGSTDKSHDIIQKYRKKYSNITYIENEKNLGLIDSLNIGLMHCKNNFIARMDMDDLIHPMRFEKQMNYLAKHDNICAVSCFMQIFNEKFETKNVSYREDFEEQKITLLFFSPLSHAGTIFRSNILKEFGYRKNYIHAEDYDLWFQIMNKYETAVLPEYLYLYRTHSNQVTNEKNLLTIKGSIKMIMRNIYNSIKLSFKDEDIDYHINNLIYYKEISGKEDWKKYHNWIIRIVKANQKSRYFNENKLEELIYKNYWQTPFDLIFLKLDFIVFLKSLFSPVNKQAVLQKFKVLLKYTLKYSA
jgi:glycosyltransferase involved in cell wall biosynthesis